MIETSGRMSCATFPGERANAMESFADHCSAAAQSALRAKRGPAAVPRAEVAVTSLLRGGRFGEKVALIGAAEFASGVRAATLMQTYAGS
jgi:hypothetical protein